MMETSKGSIIIYVRGGFLTACNSFYTALTAVTIEYIPSEWEGCCPDKEPSKHAKQRGLLILCSHLVGRSVNGVGGQSSLLLKGWCHFCPSTVFVLWKSRKTKNITLWDVDNEMVYWQLWSIDFLSLTLFCQTCLHTYVCLFITRFMLQLLS